MIPEGQVPELDLSRMRRLDDPVSRAVLAVLGEGLESIADVEKGYILRDIDDDEPGDSTFGHGEYHRRRLIPLRKARDAWRLAVERGLVPASWLADPRRCFPDQELLFYCAECEGLGATGYNYDDPCGACGGRGNEMTRGRVALPTSIDQARWMLGHPDVIEEAEALAREAVRRLGDVDGAPRTECVQWGRVRNGRPIGTIAVVIASPIWQLSTRPASWDWEAMKGPAFTRAPWWPAARKLDELTRQILCFDVGMARVHRAAGAPRSPFEPLLRLWELGVMIEELTPQAIVVERACHRYIRSWRSHVPYA